MLSDPSISKFYRTQPTEPLKNVCLLGCTQTATTHCSERGWVTMRKKRVCHRPAIGSVKPSSSPPRSTHSLFLYTSVRKLKQAATSQHWKAGSSTSCLIVAHTPSRGLHEMCWCCCKLEKWCSKQLMLFGYSTQNSVQANAFARNKLSFYNILSVRSVTNHAPLLPLTVSKEVPIGRKHIHKQDSQWNVMAKT